MAALFRFVPNTHVQWGHAWAGGLFVAVGFEVAKRVLAWYLSLVPTYSAVYGTFATVPDLSGPVGPLSSPHAVMSSAAARACVTRTFFMRSPRRCWCTSDVLAYCGSAVRGAATERVCASRARSVNDPWAPFAIAGRVVKLQFDRER